MIDSSLGDRKCATVPIFFVLWRLPAAVAGWAFRSSVSEELPRLRSFGLAAVVQVMVGVPLTLLFAALAFPQAPARDRGWVSLGLSEGVGSVFAP